MSSRPLLVVRALSVRQAQSDLGTSGTGVDELPKPIRGFRVVAGPWVLAVFRGADCAWIAAFAQSELRVFSHDVAHAAMVGPLRPYPSRPDAAKAAIEEAYRSIVDHVMSTSPSPNVISAAVGGDGVTAIDILQRIALAIDGRATVHRDGPGARVDIFRTGRRAAIASLVSSGWHERDRRQTIRELLRASRRRARTEQTLSVLARDVRGAAAKVDVAIAVDFGEATEAEVQSHPLRFGLRLYPGVVDPALGRLFVGRVDGEVAFRMTLHFSAPVLDRLVLPRFASVLAPPVALVSQCATEPRFRGRSIYPAALQWLAGWTREHGVRTLVLLIEQRNVSSLRGAAKAGFQRVGEFATQR